ncbi:MAG TPA: hypothetical protein DD671_00860 [Balneolaceae bacterium]|nr:hypothetical protein [Balneola sp.]HBQ58205.1 hypothetical protein [Balneolaceae bacterium]|tara:strand:+ start:12302 stop:12481 length:180 start_codon:yes stop_codon:yes gene_type:complete
MGTNWDEVERILDQTLKLPEEEWLGYVEKTCKEESELKKEVELLLTCIKESEGWLKVDD